jgi:hypothetical protein
MEPERAALERMRKVLEDTCMHPKHHTRDTGTANTILASLKMKFAITNLVLRYVPSELLVNPH